ncbi:MAG: Single-stranded DNA-binding protein [Chlamydiia bacterium]|nr:Single-stranded DNA-binding protein [Chlamydiia bacterium]
MNYTTIAGHLGSDPETRFTPNGRKVTSLRVACKSRKGGKDETMWWRVTIWGETFDKILPYFKKGSPIVVNGEMMPPEMYQNREGNTQISLSITAHNISFSPFGKGKSEEGGSNNRAQQPAYAEAAAPSTEAPQSFEANPISDDEIPF